MIKKNKYRFTLKEIHKKMVDSIDSAEYATEQKNYTFAYIHLGYAKIYMEDLLERKINIDHE